MAKDPIVFAMANPDPEITYEDGKDARNDVIMATGRSDYPNQVNNVLGFPFIFRGALDVRAKAITVEMKMAAVKALADLAKEKVPEIVIKAYGGKEFTFGRDYIIPKPFDPRVLWHVAPAVAKAAMDTGVARITIDDWSAYKEELQERLGMSKEVIRVMVHKAQKAPRKVVYAEGEEEKIIRAAHSVSDDNIAFPILLGNEEIIKAKIKSLGYDLENFSILDISKSENIDKYAQDLYQNRQRKGMSLRLAKELIKQPVYFGSMMVKNGDADSLIGGLTTSYPETIRPALQCIGLKERCKVVSGMYIVITQKDVYFFADCTVNINPNAEQLAEIAINTADIVKEFEIEPRVAMLSFSNFGSAVYPESLKVKEAVEIVHRLRPDLNIDGEMQADTAIVQQILESDFPFNRIKGKVNVLIFPDLNSGNIAYKLMARIGGATVVGPIIVGLKKSIHVLQRGASVDEIINLSAIAVVDAKNKG
jgi:malate dehydrogenase (oxaloacetate-decarboxylating)(NADP+)